MVQHALVAMFEAHHKGKISVEKIVEKMCHNPAILFQIEKRGFIKKGYFADLVIVNPNNPWSVNKENLLYKCADTFKSATNGPFAVYFIKIDGLISTTLFTLNTYPAIAYKCLWAKEFPSLLSIDRLINCGTEIPA